jgi:hypothetical protein
MRNRRERSPSTTPPSMIFVRCVNVRMRLATLYAYCPASEFRPKQLLIIDPIVVNCDTVFCSYVAHTFHKACIQPWLNAHGRCPLCKTDIIKAFTVGWCQIDFECDRVDHKRRPSCHNLAATRQNSLDHIDNSSWITDFLFNLSTRVKRIWICFY